jgi:hypothetical protein
MNRTASTLLVTVACLLALLVASRPGLAAGDEPPLVDNTAPATSPEACPTRTGAQLELRRVSDLDRAAREAGAAADRNGDGLVCVDPGTLVFEWPPYLDDTIVYSDWWPPSLHCTTGYWLYPLGAYVDPADPLEAYDHNHDRWICKRFAS